MSNKTHLAFEILWVSIGITCLIVTARIIILKEGSPFIFLALSLTSFLMAWNRHRLKNK